MKAIKIGLIIAVVGIIAYTALEWFVVPPPPPPPPPPVAENTEVTRIKQQINSIDQLPNNEFNKEIYSTIRYLIESGAKSHPPEYPYGRLGVTEMENNQQKKNLLKNLYSSYVQKFIQQTYFVFNNRKWSNSDLTFIKSQNQLLKNEPYLESGSLIDEELSNILKILSKHDEIINFVETNKNFSFQKPEKKDRFNTNDLKRKVNQYQYYLKFIHSDNYLKNCDRLMTNLNQLPQRLFNKHVKYLDDKVKAWTGFYINYTSFTLYNQDLYEPIKKELDQLNEIYNNTSVSSFNHFKRINDKWTNDASNAYKHKYQ